MVRTIRSHEWLPVTGGDMSKVSTAISRGPLQGGDETFSRDTMLEVLSNQRRRFVIHHLKQQEEPVTVSALAEQVASWEYGKPVSDLSHQEKKRVRNALRQFHLSKMDEYGFIEFDPDDGTAALTDAASSTNFYVDSLTDGDIPWGVYYLILSAFGIASIIGLWLAIPPFTILSPFGYAVSIVIALTISSIGHFYDNYYRMRLGARAKPAEVDTD